MNEKSASESSYTLAMRAHAGVSDEKGFWLFAAAITVIVLGANTPLPLLTVYQAAWRFSTATLTLIYGVYTAGVIAAVFAIGPVSDAVGRKRVLLPALAFMAAGLATCLAASHVWELIVGRVLQGLAVGAGVTTAMAALGELHSDPRAHGSIALTATVATVLGLAGGPLVAGSLAQLSNAPTVLPYLVALALTLLAFVGVAMTRETVAHRTRFRLRPPTIHIPAAIFAPFMLATFVEMTAYAVAGTFAGLGASFTRELLHLQGHFVAGLVVAVLFLCSAAAQIAGHRLPLRHAMTIGLLVLLVGLALFAEAAARSAPIAFFLSAAILGAGHGLAYLGSQELTDRIAPADRRAEVFSGFQLGLYVGATVPAIGVGFAARIAGLFSATFGFVAIVASIAVAGLFWLCMSRSPALRA